MLSYQSLKYREPSTIAIGNGIVKNPQGTSADKGVESLYQTQGKVHHGIQTTMKVDGHVSVGTAPRAA